MNIILKSASLTILILSFGMVGFVALAVDDAATEEAEQKIIEQSTLEADAGGDKTGIIDRAVVFDASKSVIPRSLEEDENAEEVKPIYSWDFGDGTVFEGGISETHKYQESGEYMAKLTVTWKDQESVSDVRVRIFSDVIIMISDGTAKEELLSDLDRYASQKGVYLMVLEEAGQADFLKEEALSQKLSDATEELRRANVIIDYTGGSVGLNSLSKFAQKSTKLDELGFDKKAIVSVTKNTKVLARTAQSVYGILGPQYVLLTNESAIPLVLESKSAAEVLENVKASFQEYNLIGAHTERSIKDLGPFNFLAYLNNYLVNRGVPINTIYLLLILPVIATVVSLARQVVGVKAFGIYIATIITLAFMVTGLKYGLIILVVILATSVLVRFLMKRLKLLYLPRMAIMLTIVALIIYGMYVFSAASYRTGFITISVFPILIITMLSEKFVEEQIKEGVKNAILVAIYTLIISVVCYYLVSWEVFRSLLLSYPEIMLSTIIINIILGKFSGLRITEISRFKYVGKKK